METKIVNLVGKNKFQVEEKKLSYQLNPHEVLLQVCACGICGTDLTYIKTCEHTPQNPCVIGHEFTGSIVETGSQVKHLKAGDSIIAEAGVSCYQCEFCLKGLYNFCKNVRFYGFPPYSGGFSQHVTFPAKSCYLMPKGMDPISATLVEPLAVCLHALNLTSLKFHEDVAVVGCGPIGLMCTWLLKKYGMRNIFAIEPKRNRLELAKKFGANYLINPKECDPQLFILETTNGRGVDSVFEACGKSSGLTLLPHIAKPGADVILIGIPQDDKFGFSHTDARKKGLNLKLVRRLNRTMENAIYLLNENAELKDLINCHFQPNEINEVISNLNQEDTSIIKSVLVFP